MSCNRSSGLSHNIWGQSFVLFGSYSLQRFTLFPLRTVVLRLLRGIVVATSESAFPDHSVVPLRPPLQRSEVTTLVENIAHSIQALSKGLHDLLAVVGYPFTAVKVHFAVVGTVAIAEDQPGGVVLDVAMVTFVSSYLSKQTARYLLGLLRIQ